MKIRYLLGVIVLLIGILVGITYYYGLDPSLLTKLSFYKNLANPNVYIVQVWEGLRKEEVAEIMAIKLGWDNTEKYNFINAHLALGNANLEGRYFPKTYLIDKNESPEEVSAIMFSEFSKQTEKIKKPKEIINENTAIKIASIIQREAGGKSDMRLISGIIWNRIFGGMKLQIDATLQYAKGSKEEGWWQKIDPEDKKIDSSYNTYLYDGLPPGAIANPGLDAISAAYNPQKTDCLFYLHDKNRKIHCAKTYEEHKKNIEKYY
ncbi:MAG: Aminodeoxychorismate lyase [Parcubacteria group bacterium GW2011_GWF2_38_8]|nr:MAG: Aminodeoxychorismate lyase [Parcubacteria group bacterium GW2011_GWF2_38_8]